MSVSTKNGLPLATAPDSSGLISTGRSGDGLRFREARVRIPEGIQCLLKWRDFYGKETIAQIKDISRYGCRITIPQDMAIKLFTNIPRAEITVDSAVAYNGPVIFVNEKQEADGSLSLGVSLEQSGCDLDALTAAAGLRSLGIESDLHRVLTITQNVSPEFKVLIADLNTLFQEAKQKLEGEERRITETAQSENHKFRLEERIISVAMSVYGPKFQAVLSQFQDLVSNFTVDEEIPHKQYFRLSFQSLVNGTPFISRGLNKPLGYSGDYGMMVMLYQYFDQGSTLFHRFFHRFVCSEPAAVANKNRVGFLSDILLNAFHKSVAEGKKEFTVVSLACGPAQEIYEFLRYLDAKDDVKIRIILVDSEPHALDYAQARLRELPVSKRSLDLVFLKEDVVTGILQDKPFVNTFADSDFIISAGLFDYLTDRVSQRMITALNYKLNKNGQLLIGNISRRSPDIFAMDYFMDWRLILRDEPDLLNLVSEEVKNEGSLVDVISESLGLNLFLRLRKS